ncbi:hypothetical protein V495_08210 [Pseudogymnoascus sp. VKM F-4514 (FW-929)]|nr:hypothetical protein V495_08210 [Pseudogymnoascus sp. VKM F-4514 (FW-929)]KFY58323.1 hypothetical protein V497_04910 [Pseudogymnoascus sp. VKM F-4516 (FW-969)]
MFTHIAAEEGEGSGGVGGGVPQPLFPVTYMVLGMSLRTHALMALWHRGHRSAACLHRHVYCKGQIL